MPCSLSNNRDITSLERPYFCGTDQATKKHRVNSRRKTLLVRLAVCHKGIFIFVNSCNPAIVFVPVLLRSQFFLSTPVLLLVS